MCSYRRKDFLVSLLDVTVSYHLLDEKRKEKIGYDNKKLLTYPVHRKVIQL